MPSEQERLLIELDGGSLGEPLEDSSQDSSESEPLCSHENIKNGRCQSCDTSLSGLDLNWMSLQRGIQNEKKINLILDALFALVGDLYMSNSLPETKRQHLWEIIEEIRKLK